MIKKLLLLFCCIMTGCNINCIEAGSGVSTGTVEIEVPARIKNIDEKSPASYWIDSGESITEKQEVKLTVSGAINLCPKDASHPKNVVVPAVFCRDGAIPKYSDDNDGTDPQKVCKDHGGTFDQAGRYVNTGLNVNPGDILSFSLIPRKIRIKDCRNLPPGVVIDGSGTYYRDKDGKESVSSIDVCKSGGSYYIKNEDGDISPEKIKLEPLQGKEFDVLVGNGYTPFDNKVHLNKSTAEGLPWKIGALLDLRNIRPKLQDYLNGKCDQPLNSTTKKFSSYDMNCFCNKICYTQSAAWWGTYLGPNCVSSIRYKFKNNNKCSLEMEDFDLNKETNFRTSWAELLVAKIGKYNELKWNSIGQQCIPSKRGGEQKCINFQDNFENTSLKLNYNYVIADNVNNNSHVTLGISDGENNYIDTIGGYHVKVQRTCPLADGKKLYMYIGDSPPNVLPGENGTFHLFKDDGGYIINKDNNPKKSGKIYFGVDIRGVKYEQFANATQEFADANKYTVHLFRTKWNPNFSQLFITVRDAILGVLYNAPSGTNTENISEVINSSQGGAVRQIYNNYSTSKPFWSSVRALFVLYTMFSAIGYMLGLIQLSKIDLVTRIAKMAFIVLIFSPNSWEFFSTHFFALFIHGVNQLIADFSGYLQADNSFKFLDATMGVLLAGDTWLRFLALFLAGPVGWLMFFLVIWGTINFFKCILEAMLMYLMMIISTSFLLALSPLFFTFILFQRTKQLFDGWLRLLLNFSIQPIILFAALAFLNQVMLSVLYQMTSFSACTKCSVEVKIYPDEDGGICLFKTLLPVGFSNDLDFKERIREEERGNSQGFLGLPFSLVSILLYVIIASVMKGFSSIAESISISISGALTNMMGYRGAAVNNASQALLSLVGLDDAMQKRIKKIRKETAIGRTPIKIQGSKNKNIDNKPKHKGQSLDNKNPNSRRASQENPISGDDNGRKESKDIDDKGNQSPENLRHSNDDGEEVKSVNDETENQPPTRSSSAELQEDDTSNSKAQDDNATPDNEQRDKGSDNE